MSTPVDSARRTWRPRVTPAGVWTAVVVVSCLLSAVIAAGTTSARDLAARGLDPEADTMTGHAMLVWLVGTLLAVALIWRHRWPLPIAAAACVLPILLPLDALAALVCLGGVIRRRPWRDAVPIGALTALAVWRSVWQDGRGTDEDTSFWHIMTGAQGHATPWWVVLIITAVLMAITVAVALVVRSRRDLASSRHKEAVADEKVERLGESLARQQERERLAREVHDALGHRLSLLSIHAGALEVAAHDDTRLASSAAVVRQGAQQSMDDLRSLLSVLRQPGDADVAASVPDLGDVSALVDESMGSGLPLVASVVVDSHQGLDPIVSRSAYRIVQELLTNARKHACGAPMRLQVTASPAHGIEMSCGNMLPPQSPIPPGEVARLGNGLTGIIERAEQLGGRHRVWVDEQRVFRVAILLPWSRGEVT